MMEYLPASHDEQALDEDADAYLPAPQSLQVLDDEEAANFPAPHEVHDVAA